MPLTVVILDLSVCPTLCKIFCLCIVGLYVVSFLFSI